MATAKKQPSQAKQHLSQESLKQIAETELAQKLRAAINKKVTFLLVGRAGVGKSSTINSLLGDNQAKVGAFDPTTTDVRKYQFPNIAEDLELEFVDTPGLQDVANGDQNDRTYIDRIKSRVSDVDCLLFVTRLDEARVRADEQESIRIITQAFGHNVWKRAVIVFTFADTAEAAFSSDATIIGAQDKLKEIVTQRTKRIQDVIEKYAGSVGQSVPGVAISNRVTGLSVEQETREDQIANLYSTIAERIRANRLAPFILATSSRVNTSPDEPSTDPEVIVLTPDQLIRIEGRLSDQLNASISQGIETGANIGMALGGPLGAAIGADWGARTGKMIGFLKWLYRVK